MLKVHKEAQVLKVLKVDKEPQVLKALKVVQELKGDKVPKER